MTPEIKTAWLAALRSGEYKQTQKTLKNATGYCCLGVLCHVIKGNYPGQIDEGLERITIFGDGGDSEDDELTVGLVRTLGIGSFVTEAMDRNDGVKGPPQTFAEIADWLEKVLPR